MDFATRPAVNLTELEYRIHSTSKGMDILKWPRFISASDGNSISNDAELTMKMDRDWTVHAEHHRADCDFWDSIGYDF
jgi:hypothetical protein